MEDEYRVIDYSGRWFPERLKSAGVWEVLGEYSTKEEAEQALEKIKGGKNVQRFIQKEKGDSAVL